MLLLCSVNSDRMCWVNILAVIGCVCMTWVYLAVALMRTISLVQCSKYLPHNTSLCISPSPDPDASPSPCPSPDPDASPSPCPGTGPSSCPCRHGNSFPTLSAVHPYPRQYPSPTPRSLRHHSQPLSVSPSIAAFHRNTSSEKACKEGEGEGGWGEWKERNGGE